MGDQERLSRHAEFEHRVAEILRSISRSISISFNEQVCVGGVQPDFLIQTPDGRSIIVDAKNSPPTESNIRRAIHQVQLYQEAIGADGAVVVLKDLEPGRPAEGVVGEQGLADLLSGMLQRMFQPLKWRTPHSSRTPAFGKVPRRNDTNPRLVPSPTASERAILAAVPFSDDYDDTFFVAMAHAADSLGAVCRRVDCEDLGGTSLMRLRS